MSKDLSTSETVGGDTTLHYHLNHGSECDLSSNFRGSAASVESCVKAKEDAFNLRNPKDGWP